MRVTVYAKPVPEDNQIRFFPEAPLSTSLTCCSQITVPLPVQIRSGVSLAVRDGGGAVDTGVDSSIDNSINSDRSSSSSSSSSSSRSSISSRSSSGGSGGGIGGWEAKYEFLIGTTFNPANVYRNLVVSMSLGNSGDFSDRAALTNH